MIDKRSHADPPDSPQALVDELREQILTEDTASPSDDASDTALGARAFRSLDAEFGFDPTLNQAVEGLLSNVEVLPTRDFQVRLTESVRSIVARRRATLPALLESARVNLGISLEDLAPELSISAAQLMQLETGRRPLWRAHRSKAASFVMRWLNRLKIDRADATRATRRLAVSRRVPAFAGSQQLDSEKARQFVQQLLAALEDHAPNETPQDRNIDEKG